MPCHALLSIRTWVGGLILFSISYSLGITHAYRRQNQEDHVKYVGHNHHIKNLFDKENIKISSKVCCGNYFMYERK